MATKLKKGDTVRVITGKDKDKEGKILSIDRKKNKVIVEGIAMVSKHTKANAANQAGGIIQKEAPIDASNVMYVHKGKVTRLGYKMEGNSKVRYAKTTGDVID
ncbi:MAG: 50S ribosomal protein L24 [Clostridiaceae bacterium]|nr:50S ribosomal protein L24 [Lachnospiraceae bacterium]MCI8881354.1 50S ribosomal protein L24 [Clostridiaceae bacterium]